MLDPHDGVITASKGEYMMFPHKEVHVSRQGDCVLDPYVGIVIVIKVILDGGPICVESMPPFEAIRCWILIKNSLLLIKAIT